MYVCSLFFLFTDYVRFVRSGHQHYVAVWGVLFLIIVLFLPVGFLFIKEPKLTCIWTQISVFSRASSLSRDRILPARMSPAGKLPNVRQGDWRIEEYARDFMGVARRSAMEKACLMITFWGGLGEPFRSCMPYWNPEDSLEDYINLALSLSGSAFRMETESVPGAHAVRSVPGAHAVRSRARSVPGADQVRSRARSVPGAHAVRSRARSVPGTHAVRSRACSVPGAHAVHSRACSTLVASCSACPALASCSTCPTLAPVAASVSRPSSTTRSGPPHPSPYSAPALSFPWLEARERLEAVPLRGGSVRSPGPVSSHSPPEGAISLPPGLIYLTPHTCAPTHHFPAGLNHRGLFRHLTPVPLSGKITYTHMCMYVPCFSCSPITFGLCARDTSTTLPSGVSCFWLLFCFCLLAFYLLKNRNLPAFEPRSLFFHGLPRCPVTVFIAFEAVAVAAFAFIEERVKLLIIISLTSSSILPRCTGVPGTRRRGTSFKHFIGNTEVAGAQAHTPKGLQDWTQMQGNTGLLKGELN